MADDAGGTEAAQGAQLSRSRQKKLAKQAAYQEKKAARKAEERAAKRAKQEVKHSEVRARLAAMSPEEKAAWDAQRMQKREVRRALARPLIPSWCRCARRHQFNFRHERACACYRRPELPVCWAAVLLDSISSVLVACLHAGMATVVWWWWCYAFDVSNLEGCRTHGALRCNGETSSLSNVEPQARKQGGQDKKARLQQALQGGQRIILDLDFHDLMTETEVRSLCHQLLHTYAANGRADSPAHIILTSLQVLASLTCHSQHAQWESCYPMLG